MAQNSDLTFGEPGGENLRGREESTEWERTTKEIQQKTKEQGKGFLTEQKNKAADMFEDVANALEASARQLREQTHPNSARYMDQAAQRMQSFSGTLRQRDVDSIIDQIRGFARRQPVLVVTGTLLAGFYLARLLKSGSEYEEPAQSVPVTEDVPLH